MTKSHLRSSVPCLQTSLYRSLWVVHQVHRPKFTDLSLQIPMAGAKFTDLSLHITPYKEDGKKESPGLHENQDAPGSVKKEMGIL